MHVLIAGAAGFIGSHLVDKFLSEGHEVTGIDNLTTGQLSNLTLARKTRKFKFLDADVAQQAWYPRFDGILHFASPASPPEYLRRPFDTIEANVDGTRNLLEVAREYNARFLFASTSEIYGDPLVHPQTEDYWGNVNPIGPRSVYDEAKRMGETLTSAYRRYHGVDARIIRIFNTYGPRMRLDDGRVVTNFIDQAIKGEPFTIYGDGSQTRSFCYVSDLVDLIYLHFMKDGPVPNPLNCGNPGEFTIRELANIMSELTERDESLIVHKELPVDDPRQRKPDISRATAMYGWKPKVPLYDGLLRTYAHYR